MKRLLLVLAILVGFGGPVVAQGSEIQSTIGAQMDAFQADDVGRAFEYASPTIQGIFQTPENFGGMVRNGFPMVWRPADVRYLELREIDGLLWQKVRILDAAGGVHVLDYQMIELENGWKINGVQLLDAPDLSA